eukprot:TRINITY_DN5582_c0_g1_i1.p1 TRINITY_DN5582_c0_g1~~TRINITY_DN5582_c0_g1_i1.p1  ORF type:complete len:257 (-),score=66.66 TRINITY_DN5582_c0_g1_i1:16-750(-)
MSVDEKPKLKLKIQKAASKQAAKPKIVTSSTVSVGSSNELNQDEGTFLTSWRDVGGLVASIQNHHLHCANRGKKNGETYCLDTQTNSALLFKPKVAKHPQLSTSSSSSLSDSFPKSANSTILVLNKETNNDLGYLSSPLGSLLSILTEEQIVQVDAQLPVYSSNSSSPSSFSFRLQGNEIQEIPFLINIHINQFNLKHKIQSTNTGSVPANSSELLIAWNQFVDYLMNNSSYVNMSAFNSLVWK